jgi:SP family arabinose:H+ symporter-like MFS transporter
MELRGKSYVIVICLTAGLGGFLFGFDTAVISGAINFLRVQFHLNAIMEGWIMSSALVGCVAGAAVAGLLADKFGRKKVLLFSALLFVVSALCCAIVTTPTFLVIARIVGGIGVGFAAMVAPMFISELSPANMRGRLVSLYQLAITLGILVSYLTNAGLLHYAGSHLTGDGSFMNFYLVAEVWRGMLGSNIIPALLFFIFLLFVPESPRWLIKENKTEEAKVILARINGMQKATAELNDIRNTISEEKGSFKQLLAPGIRIALIIGLVLPFLSQLTGITTVMYYAPAIFEKAGLGANSAMGSAAIIGFFNMIFTIVAIWKIDKWGRKPILIWGFIGLSIALFLIGVLFNRTTVNTGFLLGAFVLYIMIFAATLGPAVWVVISEIYPTKIRGRAMSLATLSLFIGSVFVTQTYPVLRESTGIGNTFILYGLVMLPAAFFVKKMLPETKGKSLEDIERYWKKKETLKNKVFIDEINIQHDEFAKKGNA